MNHSITVKGQFSASHRIYGYPESVHGHDWNVQIEIASNILDAQGFVYDFVKLNRILESILSVLDHTHLNSIPHFWLHSPSAENVLLYIKDKVEALLEPKSVYISKIHVTEEDGFVANWYREVGRR